MALTCDDATTSPRRTSSTTIAKPTCPWDDAAKIKRRSCCTLSTGSSVRPTRDAGPRLSITCTTCWTRLRWSLTRLQPSEHHHQQEGP